MTDESKLDAALRACADPPEESREEQDVGVILQSVLQMIGLPGFNNAWFDEHGDWDFGKLRDHGLDARLAEIRAALRACAEAPETPRECPECKHPWHDSYCPVPTSTSEIAAFPHTCGCLAHEDRAEALPPTDKERRYRYERPALKIVTEIKAHLLPAMDEEEGGWILGLILDLLVQVQLDAALAPSPDTGEWLLLMRRSFPRWDGFTTEIRTTTGEVLDLLRAAKLSLTKGAPATDKGPTLDIDQIVLDVCELPGDTDPNDPDALALTVAELRIVLEREAERLAEVYADRRVWCAGCGARWTSPEGFLLAGVVHLCGDCWRKVQPTLRPEALATDTGEKQD